jgi:hypothetical protein
MLVGLLMAAQAASASTSNLAPFAPFLGACWRAEFSATVTDTHCFEPLYDGAHVRDRHEVKDGGKTVYAGETTYSAVGSDIVFVYLNSLGGFGQGKVRGGGTALSFTGNMRASPDKPPQPIESEWRILDANHYQVRSLVKSGLRGGNPTLTFTRVKP